MRNDNYVLELLFVSSFWNLKDFDDLLQPREGSILLGRHLDGCRIGLDLGASDRKVVAVIDGKVTFSEEVV